MKNTNGTSAKSKPVLVTGAGGFIGSHLTEELVRQGYPVRAFVRYNSRYDLGLLSILPKAVLKEVEIYRGDLKDPDAAEKAVKGCRAVFHLGALIAIPYSYVHPLDFVQTNVTGTTNLLNAALRNKVDRFIHTSTSEVYGTARYVPIDERHPLQPQSPYSASKIGADMMALSFYNAFDLPVTVVRPFNTYGPRQSGRAIVPTIISQALRGGPLRLGSLRPTRDLTFVTDTVDGFIKAMNSAEAVGKVVNLGTGDDIAIEKLAKKILKLMGKDLKVIEEAQRIRPSKSEVLRLQSSNKLACDILGWKPKVGLDSGLGTTIDWVSKNSSFYPAVYQV